MSYFEAYKQQAKQGGLPETAQGLTRSDSQPKKTISPIAQRNVNNIIAVVREDRTWSAYAGGELEDFHEVLAYGKPLPPNVARYLFPEYAQMRLTYVGSE